MKDDKKGQSLQLIALVLREIIELSTSIGVTLLFGIMWMFNRRGYYMLDSFTTSDFQQAFITSALNFVWEGFSLLVCEKIVARVFRVSLLDLAQAYVGTVGRFEFFAMIWGSTLYIMIFFSYHQGTDFYFKFEWMEPSKVGNSKWCVERQNENPPQSCFYLD